jgi:DNA polymerase-3 subunit chi
MTELTPLTPPTQVDFYVLESAPADEAERFICRLCEKVYRLGQRTCILGPPDQLERLDELLWTFRPESFIPHARTADSSERKALPVRLQTQLEEHSGCDVLVNLLPTVPRQAAGESRIVELVYDEPACRAASRERFRQYRSLGLTPRTIQIDARF